MPPLAGEPEPKALVCLTSLHTNDPPMPPQLNGKRALFVLSKIDEILAWKQRKEAERDTQFVELGKFLCEVLAEDSTGSWRNCSPSMNSCRDGSRNRGGRLTT
jgi:hypothetical protein